MQPLFIPQTFSSFQRARVAAFGDWMLIDAAAFACVFGYCYSLQTEQYPLSFALRLSRSVY